MNQLKFVVRSEDWYRDLLRQARMFITGDLKLNCAEAETDRECFTRCKAQLLASIDGALMQEPEADATEKGP